MSLSSDDRLRTLAIAQGVYFAATGVWPLVHMRSFEAVTGPKADKWLVRTVGVLVAVTGGALISAAARRAVNAETALLAAGSAAGLGTIDTIYAAKGRIARIYLADAAVEAGLTSAWLAGAARARGHADAVPPVASIAGESAQASGAAMAPVACVDLNGVLDAYTGWRGPGHFDPPRPGAREFLGALRARGFQVTIFTTRWPADVWRWLQRHELDGLVHDVTDRKPPAQVFVDDRAVCFRGDFTQTLHDIDTFAAHWEAGDR